MATSTPKVPTNKDEEAALEKALAKYKRARVEAAKEFLAGPEVAALREKKKPEARDWLHGLVRDYPENPLLKHELERLR